jgi:hypothetical protein
MLHATDFSTQAKRLGLTSAAGTGAMETRVAGRHEAVEATAPAAEPGRCSERWPRSAPGDAYLRTGIIRTLRRAPARSAMK